MIFTLLLWLFITIFIAVIASFIGKRAGLSYLIAMFTGSIIINAIVASKLVVIGPFTVSAALVIYSVTFLLTDTIGEFWGKEQSKKAVWSGFLGLLMFTFVTQICIYLSPASFWQGQEAFRSVLSSSWRISLAAFVAYILAQSHDVWSYHFWKEKTAGKYLWLRNNFSTSISQLIDTVVFITIAFIGVAPLWPLIWGSVLLKIIVAIIDTPFLYLIRWYYNKVGVRFRRGVLLE